MTGQKLGHYNIVRELGKGGMGEVYLAEDTRLKREVAIKVLPESLSNDPERLKRFRREAEAAATLKHPNIATIYALEEIDGPDGTSEIFIVMEYVEGAPLSDHIPSDGMNLDTFFKTFIPLADALAHAHEHGRIHRDLKPGNIMLDTGGTPKILDFGLARIVQEPAIQTIGSEDSTKTMKKDEGSSTTQGPVFLGTPKYMSPEQADQKPTDQRSDLFSFGVVMYEALTGRKPFDGESVASVIGKIMESEPEPVTALKPVTPHQLWWVIRKCLAKNREKRPKQSIPFLNTAFREGGVQFSPDSRYVAYHSNESGQFEVYVLQFPSATGKRQVSTSGGIWPRWNGKGDELFYVEEQTNTFMAVPVLWTPGFEAEEPGPLFTGDTLNTNLSTETSKRYDVAPDGQRFVVIQSVTGDETTTMLVVHNWHKEFEDQTP